MMSTARDGLSLEKWRAVVGSAGERLSLEKWRAGHRLAPCRPRPTERNSLQTTRAPVAPRSTAPIVRAVVAPCPRPIPCTSPRLLRPKGASGRRVRPCSPLPHSRIWHRSSEARPLQTATPIDPWWNLPPAAAVRVSLGEAPVSLTGVGDVHGVPACDMAKRPRHGSWSHAISRTGVSISAPGVSSLAREKQNGKNKMKKSHPGSTHDMAEVERRIQAQKDDDFIDAVQNQDIEGAMRLVHARQDDRSSRDALM
jgi:hypothetical protein